MTICPFCGCANDLVGAGLRSMDATDFDYDHSIRCFCSMSKAQCESHYNKLEKKLELILEKEFPGVSRPRLQHSLNQLDKDSILRVNVIKRFEYLDRLKAKIKSFLNAEEVAPIVSSLKKDKKEVSILKSTSEWLLSMNKK